MRATDIVCRYGGGKFAIIFPETHLRLAVKVADRIRETIAITPVPCNGKYVSISVSMGASVYIKTSMLEVTDFVNSVNNYLYKAKQSGRNCICLIDSTDLRLVAEGMADERGTLFNDK